MPARKAPAATPGRISLLDFATKYPTKCAERKAWIETIPEYDEVVAAYQAGLGISVIQRWLEAECGYGKEATDNKVSWLAKHIERDAPAAD